jgi:hypothetical protein
MRFKISHIAAAFAICACTAAVSADPYGDNSSEQTATSEVDAKIAEEMTKLNAACGTAATAAVEWKSYASFVEADRDGRTTDNIYGIAADQTLPVLRMIADSCDNAIFKANVLRKLKSIKLVPTKGLEINAANPSHTYKLADGVFTVNYNFQTSNADWALVRREF